MPDFEDLRMIELLSTFKSDIKSIEEARSAALFKQASKDLQQVYNFHLSSAKSFAEVADNLKNLYASFNYAAVIINEALKKKRLDAEKGALLDECLDAMFRCCDAIIYVLKGNKLPQRKNKKK